MGIVIVVVGGTLEVALVKSVDVLLLVLECGRFSVVVGAIVFMLIVFSLVQLVPLLLYPLLIDPLHTIIPLQPLPTHQYTRPPKLL